MQEKSVSVLLIDAGNTRLAWRYVQPGRPAQEGAAVYHELPNQWPNVQRVIAATVAQQELLAERLQPAFNVTIEWWTQPRGDLAEFKHCYANPERLGVDRWLALLGARQQQAKGGGIVVDAGTALTIDVLDEANQHLGGYIVPGFHLAQQALFERTEKVRPYQGEQVGTADQLGQNTVACVQLGVQRQMLALIQDIARQYATYELLITGGDGQWIAQQLNAQYYHNLVLDGMEYLCAGSL